MQRGSRVVVLDLPSSAGEVLAKEFPGRVAFVAGDVREETDVRDAIAAACTFGELRVVVNCAGMGYALRTVGRDNEPYPLAKFQRTIDINLLGTFNVIRLAAAHMATLDLCGEERGVIVNTASVAAFEGQIGQAAYSASKAGIVGMTLPVARDLASLAIRVNTIAPGLFDTPLLASLPVDARDSLGKQVPHPARLGQPSEFAHLVTSIVENPMLNGEVIRLDGAIRMGPR